MLYLIGGVYRTGKTSLAQRVLAAKSVPFASTDALVHMLKNAAPELGVTDDMPLEQKADTLYPYLEQFVKYALYSAPDYLLEGDAVWPNGVVRLQQAHILRAVFLGFSEVDAQTLLAYAGHNDWLSELKPEEVRSVAREIVRTSERISNECKKYGLSYIDLAGDYAAKHAAALKLLIKA